MACAMRALSASEIMTSPAARCAAAARGAAATREAASIRETATPRTAGTPARRPVSPGRHPPGGPTSAAPWRGSKRRLMVGVDDPDDDQDGDDDQPYGQAAEQDRIVLGALR